jgi:protein-disulfide isomerase
MHRSSGPRGVRHPGALVLALAAALGCGSPKEPTSPAASSTEIDLSRPAAARPAWPAGLVPCAKDAPEGESCAAKPKAAPAAPGSGAPAVATPPDDTTVWNVPVGADDPARGPADALVTMVVFSDFECPFCRHATGTFERILTEHEGDVRLVWMDLPLPMHEHAEAAAELARVARAERGDAGFWAAHDLLYDAQDKLGEPMFREIARKLGLPWPSTLAAIRSARYGAIIQRDVALSDRVDVQATPTTFVNGRRLVGAQPYARTSALVDEELAHARRLVSSGTPRADVYRVIVSAGKQVSPPTDAP